MKVFIIGTGNVAFSLGNSFLKNGHVITGVLGRDEVKATRLAGKLQCGVFTKPQNIPLSSDIYLVAISDDAISKVVAELPRVHGIVAHTSGASPLSLLSKFKMKGVFYPVETITKTRPVSFKKIPFCIEGSDEHSFRKLTLLAGSISGEIYSLNSEQRAMLHVAAVFTNNFTNCLLGIATDLLARQHLPPSLLKPLALSTVQNAFKNGAYDSQTGPARRNDLKTIARHMKLLKTNKNYQEIYRVMTDEIKVVHNKKEK